MFVWKINDSPQCYICEEIDNLEHYFYYCTSTRSFWKQVEKWIQSIIPVTLYLAVLDVLFGILNADPMYYYLLNYVILSTKYFIFTTKKQNEDLFFLKFLHTLKMRLALDKKLFKEKVKTEAFAERFDLLYEFI